MPDEYISREAALSGELIGWFGNLPNYCPNCGAKMDGGFDDATS